eukprot:3740851-Pyramimonas_sp.AAC.1
MQPLVRRAPEIISIPCDGLVEPADGAAGCLVVRLVVGRSQRIPLMWKPGRLHTSHVDGHPACFETS